MKKYRFYIGVDPSFRKHGFGLAMIDTVIKDVTFVIFKDGFLGFQRWMKECPRFMNAVVCIENSNLQNTSFDTTGRKGVVARKSRNVGTNQAVSQLSVDFCREIDGYLVIEVSPKQKGKKWSIETAMSVIESEGLTPNKTKISQDEADSLQLALMGKQRSIIEQSKRKK